MLKRSKLIWGFAATIAVVVPLVVALTWPRTPLRCLSQFKHSTADLSDSDAGEGDMNGCQAYYLFEDPSKVERAVRVELGGDATWRLDRSSSSEMFWERRSLLDESIGYFNHPLLDAPPGATCVVLHARTRWLDVLRSVIPGH